MSLIVPKSLTETDPVFSAAPASGIAASDITNWDTAYGWGDHAAAGYLASGDIGSTVLAYDANLQAFTTALTLPTVDGTLGQVLETDGAGNLTFTSPTVGTVTNVGLSVPTGFSVSDTPITSSGTLALGFDTGYSLPTTANQANWNTAYGWGDHAAVGYLTSFTETDPVFSAAPASGIAAGDITNWDTAYGWGDHAAAGYLGASDIGSTVLAYDANLQAFTTALTLPTVDGTAGQTLKTDGAGTVSFADVVTNGQVINGTAFFVTDTKPTTRIGGAALVAGDRWEKPSDGTSWFWNGTYWLGMEERIFATASANGISTTTALGIIESKSPVITSESLVTGQLNVFVTRCLFHSREMTTNDASNYWQCNLLAQNGFGTSPAISPVITTVDTIGVTINGIYGRRKNTSLNQLLTAIPYNITAVITKVGTPSSLVAHFIYLYRTAYI